VSLGYLGAAVGIPAAEEPTSYWGECVQVKWRRVVQDVHNEADQLAHRDVAPPGSGALDEEREIREKRLRVKAAAKALCAL
jgi:hypothetical protein